MTTKLRAHHLLCMLSFAGKGYSMAFVDNFSVIVDRIAGGSESIEIVEGPDDVCAPLLSESGCHCHKQSVKSRDLQAMEEISNLLNQHIAPGIVLRLESEQIASLRIAFSKGTIRSACTGCQWVPLCDSIACDNFRKTRLVRITHNPK